MGHHVEEEDELGDESPHSLFKETFLDQELHRIICLPIIGFHPEMALFSDELRSPRVYFLDVRSVRLVVNPCAAKLIEKNAHFQIGN